MAGVLDSVHSLIFRRTTTYVPFLLAGAYFSNEVRQQGHGDRSRTPSRRTSAITPCLAHLPCPAGHRLGREQVLDVPQPRGEALGQGMGNV